MTTVKIVCIRNKIKVIKMYSRSEYQAHVQFKNCGTLSEFPIVEIILDQCKNASHGSRQR